jgi:hypothetical protein
MNIVSTARSSSSLQSLMRLVAGLLPFVLATCILLFSYTGYSWMDEVGYADPAVRLALGKGFTSAVWWHQSEDSFWAGNTPLPALVVSVVYHLFGVSSVAGRLFWLAVYAASVSAVLYGMINRGLLRNFWLVVFAASVLLLSPAGWQAAALGRPDAIGILLCSSAFAIACRNPTSLWLSVIAACLVWTGPQLWVFAPLAIMLSLPIIDPKCRQQLVLNIATGAIVGAISLGALYIATDSHIAFLNSTLLSGHNSAGQIAQNSSHIAGALMYKGWKVLTAPAMDAWTLLFAIGPLLWMLVTGISGRPRKLQLYALLWCLVIPMGMSGAGKYPPYYHWMALFPTVIAAVSSWQLYLQGRAGQSRIGPKTLWLAAGATAAFSILAYGSLPRKERPEQILIERLPSDQPILADFLVYFQVIGRHPTVFAPTFGGGRLLPELPNESTDCVRWAILSKDNLSCLKKWKGEWEERDRVQIFVPSFLHVITRGVAGRSNSLDRELVLLERTTRN